ncbi:MAG: hypothetical protein JW806_06425 [Sedimentisphaerales bacterium]|nr:hypothetical protein [Sedimentisphaerales bacterium]
MKLNVSVVLFVITSITLNASASIFFTGQTGSWSDPNMWDKGFLPDDTEAVKIVAPASLCTIDSDIGIYSIAKISVASGPDSTAAAVLNLAEGGRIGIASELRIGDASATANGDIGYFLQTGGRLYTTINGKIIVGYKENGIGNYTISSGSLTGQGTLFVGGSGEDGAEGTLTVTGRDPLIAMRKMYVGAKNSQGQYPGIGTLAFEVGSQGVSPIKIAESIYLDPDGSQNDASVANLVVTLTEKPIMQDIVLLEDTSGGNIYGRFSFVNGEQAAEGASVVLNYENANYHYTLTYAYDAEEDGNANDIALITKGVTLIPEPATMILMAISSLLITRKKPAKT